MNHTAASIASITNEISLMEAAANRYYIIASFSSKEGISIAPNPVIYSSPAKARDECARLATKFPGNHYIMLTVTGGEYVPKNPTTSY